MRWTVFHFFLVFGLISGSAPLIADWSVPVEFSVGDAPFKPFGKLVFRESDETKFVSAAADLERQLASALKSAIAANATELSSYKFRASNVRTSTYPCLFLLSNLGHEISVSVDMERHKIHSLTVFPAGIYDLDAANERVQCGIDAIVDFRPKFIVSVRVIAVGELPSPDTASYLQRIEDEKRARQHGATQHNHSFLAKYWMYILPAVIFLVVSNAFNADPQGQSE